MSKHKESRIEDFAYDYLQTYYANRTGATTILTDKDEKTKKGYKADGLISFLTPEKTLFIATLSTSHSDKLVQLLTHYKAKGLSKLRFLTGGLFLAASFLAGWKMLLWPWWYALALGLLMGFVAFTAHTLLARKSLKSKVTRLVQHLSHLPADEQWLGLSISSLTFRNNTLAKHLLAICKQRGIGMITVGKRSKVVQLLEPVTQKPSNGDYLAKYESEVKIRKSLLGDSYLRVA